MVVGFTLLLASAPAMAQMMGGGQQQQAVPQQQYYPNQMYPGMMGGYGSYGMGPGMMGNYGYGMGPGMKGNYGYGMGPGMMGGYGGYGMGPGMMGGYGYGMGPGMMGNYGYGICPNCGAYQGQQFKSNEDYSKFLDDTKEQRKKLHGLMFEYNEEMRSPNPDKEKLAKMGKEIDELRSEIFNYKIK
jgi:hypothetical protein